MNIIKNELGAPAFMGSSFGSPFGLRSLQNHMTFEAEGHSNGGEGGSGEATSGKEEKPANHKVENKEGKGGDTQTKPSDSEAALLREVMKGKEERQKLQEQLKAFEGIDPTATRELLANIEKERKDREEKDRLAEEERMKAAGDWEALKRKMQEEREVERKADKDAVAAAEALAKSYQDRNKKMALTNDFSNSSYLRENFILSASKAQIMYGGYFEVDDNGQVMAYDSPNPASRSPLVDAGGNPIPFEQAIKKIVESDPDHEKVVKTQQKPGSGSRPAVGANAQAQVKEFGLSRLSRLMRKEAEGK